MKIESKIKDILFATNANGLVSCLIKVVITPELEKLECGGVGFGIGTHLEDNRLPFKIGDDIQLNFTEKGDIADYVIIKKGKGFTKLPRKCVACGSDFKTIKNKETVEALLCQNVSGCTAQSTSPIYRLAVVADQSACHEDVLSFINEFPEVSLTHLSDLRILLQSDPNTASREAMWKNLKAWKIESNVWNFLNSDTINNWDFWYIGFNIEFDLDPRFVLNSPTYEIFPEIIQQNIDRLEQLIKFFDHWKVKNYAAKAK